MTRLDAAGAWVAGSIADVPVRVAAASIASRICCKSRICCLRTSLRGWDITVTPNPRTGDQYARRICACGLYFNQNGSDIAFFTAFIST